MKFAIIAATLLASSIALAHSPGHQCGGDESGHHSSAQAAPSMFNSAQKVGTKATCPVSGESFTISEATAHSEYKGKFVYFCCPGCKKQFDRNPEKYLAARS